MEHCALNYPPDVFEMAAADYSDKLKKYCDDKGDPSFERFYTTEQTRIEQLAKFNHPGSVHADKGNNEKVRGRDANAGAEAKGL